ncbi:sulfurtransferase TusA family protein [Desulfitobacterium sp.]|uniref:sulfurtransferase TusA family protein n=1 Tax=Desulfitobacterium sp. TaxID=49981 RepID=UPI002C3B341A|nr:sulfurtransferase TusA family protein [Desulfitobacterium sp.]HVJ49076.1 sulfurtransferase TusA family protein [Desulfitobacterium sp.]
MSEVQITKTIDARGAFCPGPLMELVKTIKRGNVGEVYELLSSDSGSAKDVPEWVNKMGHALVDSKQDGDFWRITVKKMK